MKRLALALTGLVAIAGCQILSPAPVSHTAPVSLPRAAAPEILLDAERLQVGAAADAVTPAARQAVLSSMKARAAEAGVPAAGVDLTVVTVGTIKARRHFAYSYLSDDSKVVLATSEGRFEVADAENGVQPTKVYGKLMGMFDPVTGDTLGLGFVP